MNSSVFFFLSAVLVFSIVDGQQNCPRTPCKENECCYIIRNRPVRCYPPSTNNGPCDPNGECPVCEKDLNCNAQSRTCGNPPTSPTPPTEPTIPETPEPPTTPGVTTPSPTTPSVTTPSPTTPDAPVR